jgi:hypothetical protein
MTRLFALPGFLLMLPFVAYWVVRALVQGEER